MSEHDCLNNEDQLDSVLDEVAQIDSEFDSVDDIDSDLEKVVEVIKDPKIMSISVNGENIQPDEEKNVNIEIPTTTSGFTNDGEGTSPFATEKYVELYGGKIDSISIDGVNQTIDENKNVDLKGLASTEFVEDKIQKLVGLAPETLDTLEEIAKELGENESVINSISDTLKSVVDLNSEQRIDGIKSFQKINIIGENIVPVYEEIGRNTYEYTVENIPASNSYGFELNDNGYYESNNKGKNNSFALCKVSFTMWEQNDLVLELINYAESSYDFGMFSQLDKTLGSSYTEDTDNTIVYKSYKGESSANPINLIYNTVPTGEHFITIKFKKDSSQNSFNDSLQFKIVSPVGEVIKQEIVGYEDFFGEIDIDEDKDLTYDGEKLAKQSSINEINTKLENVVNLDKEQTITGTKKFAYNYPNGNMILNGVAPKINMPDLLLGSNSSIQIGKDVSWANSGGILIGQNINATSNTTGGGNVIIGTGIHTNMISGSTTTSRNNVYIGSNNSSTKNLGGYNIAIGNLSYANGDNLIQLGQGTNSNSNTFQVFEYQMLNAEGKIPNERLDFEFTTTEDISRLFIEEQITKKETDLLIKQTGAEITLIDGNLTIGG